jgi:FAD/FMN-containing dehydrogenase
METITLDDTLIESFAHGLLGPLIRPGDDGYEDSRRRFNGMYDRRPAMIAQCVSTSDVIRAVRFAREHDLLVAVRAGGHSTPGHSSVDGGLVIDVSRMKGIRVDPENRTVRAEAGITMGELDHETQAFGLAVTGGEVSDTGIAGLTLGGGLGRLVRAFGYTVDNLLSVDIVTADGRLLKASESENADLFWGVRGGGGNFGIVTSFEYRLHPVGPLVFGGMMIYPIEQARDALRFYSPLASSAPDELRLTAILLTAPPLPFVPVHLHGKPVLVVEACWAGDLEEGARVVAPMRSFGRPAVDLMGPIPYTVLQKIGDPATPWGAQYYDKMQYLSRLDDDAIDTILASMDTVTSPATEIHLFPLGGAVSRLPEDHTAMGNRDTAFVLWIIAAWQDPDELDVHRTWARSFWSAMEPFSTGRKYLNADTDSTEDRVRASYRPETYRRLVALKEKYDPTNFFRLNPNIRPQTDEAANAA